MNRYEAYVGLIDVSFWPLLLFTHSLLMNRPVGWVYFLPLGAVSSIEKSDILADVRIDLYDIWVLDMEEARKWGYKCSQYAERAC